MILEDQNLESEKLSFVDPSRKVKLKCELLTYVSENFSRLCQMSEIRL